VVAAVLAGLLALLVWSRLSGLDQSLWHDEVWTVVYYVRGGPRAIFGRYIPNDHMLFSLLAWATASALGPSEVVYRLWAVVPGCVAIVVLVAWLVRRDGGAAAIAAAILGLTSPIHLQYGRDARGYGLAFLAEAVLVVAATELAARGARGAGAPRSARGPAIALALAGVAGMCTLPVLVLPFVAAVAALAILGDARARRSAIATAAFAGVVALAFYAPVARQVVVASSQKAGPKVPWSGFATLPPAHLFQWHADAYLGATSALAVRVATYVAFALGFVRALRLAGAAGALAIALPIPFTYAALAAAGMHLEPRFVSWLAMNGIALAALGVAEAIERAARRPALGKAAVAAASIAGALAVWRFVAIARDHVALPRENWKAVAEIVQQSGIATVVSDSGRRQALDYYLGRPVLIPSAEGLDRLLCRDSSPLVFVHHPVRSVPADRGCLERSGARRYVVPQRTSYGGDALEVWIRAAPERASEHARPAER